MRFRRALVITIVLQSVGLGLSALFILLTARWLGAAGKGVQSLLVVGGQFTAVLLGFGFQGAVPAAVSASPERAHGAAWVQTRLLVAAITVIAAIGLLNRILDIVPVIRGLEIDLGVFIVATIAQLFLASLALALLDFWTSNISTAVAAASMLGLSWIMWSAGLLTPRTAILAQSLGLIFGCITVVARLGSRIAPRRRGPWRTEIEPYRAAALLGYLSSVFGLVMFRGDIFLVTKLGGGVRVAGLYAIAAFAAELCLRVPQWAGAILTPNVAANAEAGRLQTIKLLWLSMGLASLAFAAAAVFHSAVLFVLTRVAGREFSDAYPMLLALFPRVVLQSAWAILSNNLAGKGFTFFHPAATFVGMLGVWGAEWLLIPKYGVIVGISGASIGYLLAMIVTFAGFLRHNQLSVHQFLRMSLQSAGFPLQLLRP